MEYAAAHFADEHLGVSDEHLFHDILADLADDGGDSGAGGECVTAAAAAALELGASSGGGFRGSPESDASGGSDRSSNAVEPTATSVLPPAPYFVPALLVPARRHVDA